MKFQFYYSSCQAHSLDVKPLDNSLHITTVFALYPSLVWPSVNRSLVSSENTARPNQNQKSPKSSSFTGMTQVQSLLCSWSWSRTPTCCLLCYLEFPQSLHQWDTNRFYPPLSSPNPRLQALRLRAHSPSTARQKARERWVSLKASGLSPARTGGRIRAGLLCEPGTPSLEKGPGKGGAAPAVGQGMDEGLCVSHCAHRGQPAPTPGRLQMARDGPSVHLFIAKQAGVMQAWVSCSRNKRNKQTWDRNTTVL